MSGYQHKEGFGSVKPNQYKTDDRHPDLKGDGMINGVVVDIALWKKPDGRYSVKLETKRERQAAAPQPAREAPPGRGGAVDDSDSIPFNACKE